MDEPLKPKGPYHAICIGAGAAGGYQLLGALQYFYTETDWMKDVRIFAGTSVGACVSGMLAIGYLPDEILDYLCTHDVNEFFQYDLLQMGQKWGMVDTDFWRDYVAHGIIAKYGSDPTLEELFEKTGHTICFATWRMTKTPNQVYIQTHTHPNIRLSEAIVLSTTIPCIFTKCEYKGDLYIDGGIFDSCPTQAAEGLMLEDERILVLRLEEPQVSRDIHSLMDYMKTILNVFHLTQKRTAPDAGDEIVLKTEFSGVSLQVEKEKRVQSFNRAFKRIKYQLFLPKLKKE